MLDQRIIDAMYKAQVSPDTLRLYRLASIRAEAGSTHKLEVVMGNSQVEERSSYPVEQVSIGFDIVSQLDDQIKTLSRKLSSINMPLPTIAGAEPKSGVPSDAPPVPNAPKRSSLMMDLERLNSRLSDTSEALGQVIDRLDL